MRVFKLKAFVKAARRLGIRDAALQRVVEEIEAGKIDAALGGEVFKQRVARSGGGKSGGYRTIFVFRRTHRCVFVEAFAKNESANMTERALVAIRDAAAQFLAFDEDVVTALVESGAWTEVKAGETEI